MLAVERNGMGLLFCLTTTCLFFGLSPMAQGQEISPNVTLTVTDTVETPLNSSRNPDAIEQVQFQELPPLAPTAESEGKSAEATTGDDLMPTEPIQTSDDAAGGTESEPMLVDEILEGPFDGSYVEQDATLFYSSNNTFRRGLWYSKAEFVALLRTEGQDVPIAADQSDGVIDESQFTLNRPVITSKTTDHTYEPGVRLTLGRFLGQDVANRDHSLEFTFFGLFEFEDTASIRSTALPGYLDTALGAFKFETYGLGIVGNNVVPGFTGGLVHSTDYQADLNSGEVNYRIMGRPLRDRIALQPNGSWVRHGTASALQTFVIGARYIRINEDFKYRSEFFESDDSGFLNVRTGNDLFGLHAGVEISESYTNWSWGARGRFGGLYNLADRNSFLQVVTDGAVSERGQKVHKNNLAAAVEAGLSAQYQIRTNLVARVSYDAMYITGIASAPENLGLAPEWPNFEVTGDVLYHGLSVGFEMLW